MIARSSPLLLLFSTSPLSKELPSEDAADIKFGRFTRGLRVLRAQDPGAGALITDATHATYATYTIHALHVI